MKEPLPQLEPTADGFRVRLRYGKGKQAKFNIPMRDERAAMKRADKLRDLARSLQDVPDEESRLILDRAASAASESALTSILKVAGEELNTKPQKRNEMTFAALAEEWTSGRLHTKYPDHVATKRTAVLDEQRFATLNKHIGQIPLSEFLIEDADRAMAALPSGLSPATRRQYGQLLARVLKLSVYPCRLRESSPLPPGWIPRLKGHKAKSWLYPDEEGDLLACRDIPIKRRLLYAFLARERELDRSD